MKLKHILIAGCLLVISACDNEENTPIETLEGTLEWTGKIETDGCGYILTVDGNSRDYKPANESAIPGSYQTGSPIRVVVKAFNYNKTIIPCRTTNEFNLIEVLSIQRK